MDTYLLEELAKAQAQQTSKLTPDSKGVVHCIFHIEEVQKQRLKEALDKNVRCSTQT